MRPPARTESGRSAAWTGVPPSRGKRARKMANVAEPNARFDTLIRGGEVVDPGGGQIGRLDVALKDGKVAEVRSGIDAAAAAEVIDAAGLIVTPGLVDLHTHVYWGATYWGIEPDPVAARTGVTTWLDVGSAGAYSFPGFRRYVAEPARSRVYALLNLSSIGLIGPTWEFANPDYCDVELAATIVEAHRDVILGIKARIDSNTTRGVGARPIALARELADAVGLPLMVHIGNGPPWLSDIVPHLRPGDILTHCFTGGTMRILREDGTVDPAIKDLQERGLILDIGHGAGSFSFESTERLLDQGVLPDSISSDIHQLAIQGPMYDLPTTISKFLAFGMPLADAIDRATARPARAMGRPDLGTLAPGSAADVALFRIDGGDFTFQDVHMNERKGTKRLVNTLTMVDGKTLSPDLPESPLQPWAKLPDHQRVGLKAVGGVRREA
jgi:dihydroorotase